MKKLMVLLFLLLGFGSLDAHGLSSNGIIWDRSAQGDTSLCDAPVIKRVNLLSHATTPLKVVKVFFSGPDAYEYKITGNQPGYSPFEGFILNPGDTIWVEYQFTPDLGKPWSVKYGNRHTDLVCTFYTDQTFTALDTTLINFTATVNYPALKILSPASDTIEFGVIPLKTLSSKYGAVTDTGTAPLTICEIKFGYPIKQISNAVTQKIIQNGDVIDTMQIFGLQVDALLDAIGDTVVPITFYGCEPCAEPRIIYAHISAALNAVSPVNQQLLKVYATDKNIIIELPMLSAPPYGCALYDLLGRMVKEWSREEMGTQFISNTLLLPLPKLSKGCYLFRVPSGETLKILID